MSRDMNSNIDFYNLFMKMLHVLEGIEGELERIADCYELKEEIIPMEKPPTSS